MKKRKKYVVSLPFCGSLQVEVFADNEDDALRIGEIEICKIPEDVVMQNIEWENYEIYED